MRMFSLLGRAAVRSPFVFGSTARAALPHFNVLPLVAAAGVISVLAQPPEAAECMGKRKKKDSVLEDDMYEVDYIKARKLEKGKPLYLIRWKGFDDDKYDTWEPLENVDHHVGKPALHAYLAMARKLGDAVIDHVMAGRTPRAACEFFDEVTKRLVALRQCDRACRLDRLDTDLTSQRAHAMLHSALRSSENGCALIVGCAPSVAAAPTSTTSASR